MLITVEFDHNKAQNILTSIGNKYETVHNLCPDGLSPYSYNVVGIEAICVHTTHWCAGFYPAILWEMAELSNEVDLMNLAESKTKELFHVSSNTGTHDLGFMIGINHLPAFHQTIDSSYLHNMVEAAISLQSRFDPQKGVMQSWNSSHKWDYPVIIDNLMNLELLLDATLISGDSVFYRMAISHADTTLKYHFRDDYSTWHVLDYGGEGFGPSKFGTSQGFSDNSCWARGQAWALYGYTMLYRKTGYDRYLDQANKIANYILLHRNYPEDGIPYWDFELPNTWFEPKDASAAAIISCALLELSQFVDDSLNVIYLNQAKTILNTLSGSPYLIDDKGPFVLDGSVGDKPRGHGVGVPMIYADYYFIKALKQYLSLR